MIRCGGEDGNEIGVPYASSVTVGVGVGVDGVDDVLPPHAANSNREESSNGSKRRE
jgi:hypothetical protein